MRYILVLSALRSPNHGLPFWTLPGYYGDRCWRHTRCEGENRCQSVEPNRSKLAPSEIQGREARQWITVEPNRARWFFPPSSLPHFDCLSGTTRYTGDYPLLLPIPRRAALPLRGSGPDHAWSTTLPLSSLRFPIKSFSQSYDLGSTPDEEGKWFPQKLL